MLIKCSTSLCCRQCSINLCKSTCSLAHSKHLKLVSCLWMSLWSIIALREENLFPQTTQSVSSSCIIVICITMSCLLLEALEQMVQLNFPLPPCCLFRLSLPWGPSSFRVIMKSSTFLWFNTCSFNLGRSGNSFPQWKHLKILIFSCIFAWSFKALLSLKFIPQKRQSIFSVCNAAICLLKFRLSVELFKQTAQL